MRFFIMGGTGFIGKILTKYLVSKGHQVQLLVRNTSKNYSLPEKVSFYPGSPLEEGDWQQQAAKSDVLINLTGSSILKRWSSASKELVLDTRLQSTRQAATLLDGLPPKVFICANAVGFYGDRDSEILDENSAPGLGFLARVCSEWEQEALRVEQSGHRVVVCRFGAVLGKGGGPMSQVLSIFTKGLGGIIGSGKQWLSWIHVSDLVRAVVFVAQNENIHGPVNFTSPNPVTNREFTKTLGQILRRPTLLPVPALALRLLYNGAAEVLLNSQHCLPHKLLNKGFHFDFDILTEALKEITINN